MPMIGLIDPTHKERANGAAGRYPRWVSVKQALEQSANASPKWAPWPHELIAAVLANHQERDYLSVTALTGGCMRGNVVERKEDYIGDLDSMYASIRGTMIHRTLELVARPGSLAEWRFFTSVDGEEISCSPDLVTYDAILDWKTTENPPTFGYMWSGHKLQLQFNRFCFNNATKWANPEGLENDPSISLDPAHTKIQHLAIVYLGPKGPKVIEHEKTVEQATGKGYTRKAKVPDVWSDAQVLKELRPRMEAWHLAMNSYPKWPKGLEDYPGWEGPPEWHCSGAPLCYLPGCLAKRLPAGLTWKSP
jgi:hypothetical protein